MVFWAPDRPWFCLDGDRGIWVNLHVREDYKLPMATGVRIVDMDVDVAVPVPMHACGGICLLLYLVL